MKNHKKEHLNTLRDKYVDSIFNKGSITTGVHDLLLNEFGHENRIVLTSAIENPIVISEGLKELSNMLTPITNVTTLRTVRRGAELQSELLKPPIGSLVNHIYLSEKKLGIEQNGLTTQLKDSLTQINKNNRHLREIERLTRNHFRGFKYTNKETLQEHLANLTTIDIPIFNKRVYINPKKLGTVQEIIRDFGALSVLYGAVLKLLLPRTGDWVIASVISGAATLLIMKLALDLFYEIEISDIPDDTIRDELDSIFTKLKHSIKYYRSKQ